MKLKRLISMIAIVVIGAFSVLAVQDSEDPSWLIQRGIADSLIEVSVVASQNIYNEFDRPNNFITFELSEDAYVYAFNVTPLVENTTGEAREVRNIQMLLPNQTTDQNFFEAGSHTLNEEYIFQVPPYGVGYLQVIATPVPLDFEVSAVDQFAFMGNDPELFFSLLQAELRAKDVIEPEWAASWTSYFVEQDSPTPSGAGATCTSIVVEVRNLTPGQRISADISRSCVSGAVLHREFISPVSNPFFQVLQGTTTVTLNGPGIPPNTSDSIFAAANQQNRIIFDFQAVPGVDSFEFTTSPENPKIYQDIVFTPVVQTTRPISNIAWDFGDGFTEVSQPGVAVTHSYSQATTSNLPYRVRMTVNFADQGSPPLQNIFDEVHVDTFPPPCPSGTVQQQNVQGAVLFTSTSPGGCDSLRVPNRLISVTGTPVGLSELAYSYAWNGIPQGAVVQAFLQISYISQATGGAIGSEETIPLLPNDGPIGVFINRLNELDIPANSNVAIDFVLNVIDNPSGGLVDFELRGFQISEVQNCDDASITLFNNSSQASGTVIGFARGTQIQIQLNNQRCDDLVVQPNGVEIRHNGQLVASLGDALRVIEDGDSETWMWDQRDDFGTQVPSGFYSIRINTNLGSYWARAQL